MTQSDEVREERFVIRVYISEFITNVETKYFRNIGIIYNELIVDAQQLIVVLYVAKKIIVKSSTLFPPHNCYL